MKCGRGAQERQEQSVGEVWRTKGRVTERGKHDHLRRHRKRTVVSEESRLEWSGKTARARDR